MNLYYLVFAICPIALCIVSLGLCYLFGKAFESASRNTEAINFINSQLLIAAGLVELGSILIIGIFFILFLKIF